MVVVVLLNLGKGSYQRLGAVISMLSVSRGQLVGILAGLLGNGVQSTNSGLQAHVLLANSLVVSASVVLVGVNVVTPYNGRSEDGVVDQLCSVLTRASGR